MHFDYFRLFLECLTISREFSFKLHKARRTVYILLYHSMKNTKSTRVIAGSLTSMANWAAEIEWRHCLWMLVGPVLFLLLQVKMSFVKNAVLHSGLFSAPVCDSEHWCKMAALQRSLWSFDSDGLMPKSDVYCWYLRLSTRVLVADSIMLNMWGYHTVTVTILCVQQAVTWKPIKQ